MNDRNRRVISILTIFTIIFTVMGGSLAYWTWTSDAANQTGVAFTIDKDFSCSADGGGHITPSNISLEPSTCTNPNTSIKRKIVVTPDIKKDGLEISLDMWLNVNSLGTGLSNSVNLKYVLTTSESSCEEGTIISSGNFSSKTSGDRVMLLEKNYTADASETYYLYIWLDKEETSMDTMNQSFDFSIGGNCSNYVGEPEAPVLDPAMIPVKIANDGTVTTVSANDPNWYNYENKQWANIVLVNEEATEGVTNSQPRSYYQNNIGEEVTEEDILAYYVWIPRYKYKIPTNKYCYEIENPTPEKNPECYQNSVKYDVDAEILKETVRNWIGEETYMFCNSITEDGGPTCSDEEIEYIIDELSLNSQYTNSIDGSIHLIEDIFPSNYYHSDPQFISERYVKGETEEIDIIFESKEENMVLGNATTQYRSHPSFWWDEDSDNVLESDETIAGIWMAKFETTGSEEKATVLPNQQPQQNQKISKQFSISQGFSKDGNIYGLDSSKTDAHITKNRDWGAAVYLAHSNYGKNSYISINANYELTGCGYDEQNYIDENCVIPYGKKIEYPQTTTGNISGIFDMSGGTSEYVMGNLGNDVYQSEFAQMPPLKYYDYYSETIFTSYDIGTSTNDNLKLCTIDTCGGHALHENGIGDFVQPDLPWLIRGRLYYDLAYGPAQGDELTVNPASGCEYIGDISWRTVMVTGLTP